MQISVKAAPAHEARGEILSLFLSRPDAKPAISKRGRRAKGKKVAEAKPSLPLPSALRRLDRSLGGALSAVLASGDFAGREGEACVIHPAETPPRSPRRVQLIGLGAPSSLTLDRIRRAAGRAVSLARTREVDSLAVWTPSLRGFKIEAVMGAVAEGLVLGAYRFDAYKSGSSAKRPAARPRRVQVLADKLAQPGRVRAAVKAHQIAAEGQNLARDLSNEPPNRLAPADLAREARRVARATGLTCQVLAPAELERRGLHALLAVGSGSARSPRLIVLEHKPAGTGRGSKRTAPLCIVGKGITFDSGGLSLKTASGMVDMKHDMSGAATVIGLMQAVARQKLPVHVVAVIAAAENMPSGTAYRPGDIIESMSGKTIEVLNTDAEGRVVLADALHYACEKYSPAAVVDIATLTGAAMVALGPWATAVLSRDDELAREIESAGQEADELMWRLPLLPEHTREMKSTVADLKNTGGSYAGVSTAAAFLAEFVEETPWVHLDIAGSGWTTRTSPIHRGGGTGVAVRTLLSWIHQRSNLTN